MDSSTFMEGRLGRSAARVPAEARGLRGVAAPLKIQQRGVKWKQGVFIQIIVCTVLLHNATPIHCTPYHCTPFC